MRYDIFYSVCRYYCVAMKESGNGKGKIREDTQKLIEQRAGLVEQGKRGTIKKRSNEIRDLIK